MRVTEADRPRAAAASTRCPRDREVAWMTGGVGGLILAAGEGTRFGPEPKLLAELDGRPLLEYAVRAQCEVSALEPVVVVLGAHAEQLRDRVDFMRAQVVLCDAWRQGQAASLRRGLEELRGASKVIVTLGDEPLITSSLVARFLTAPAGARAVYNGRPGHPVALGREQIDLLMSLTGDRGARDLLFGGPEIDLGDAGDLGRDVDTTADLERMRNEARTVV